jgi:sugar/nucleoside kinase (ribokinase family)
MMVNACMFATNTVVASVLWPFVSLPQVEVQDTVGCGDSFAAAIVMGFINKAPIPATLALANAVGAATATGRGAGRNVATADKVCEESGRGGRD